MRRLAVDEIPLDHLAEKGNLGQLVSEFIMKVVSRTLTDLPVFGGADSLKLNHPFHLRPNAEAVECDDHTHRTNSHERVKPRRLPERRRNNDAQWRFQFVPYTVPACSFDAKHIDAGGHIGVSGVVVYSGRNPILIIAIKEELVSILCRFPVIQRRKRHREETIFVRDLDGVKTRTKIVSSR